MPFTVEHGIWGNMHLCSHAMVTPIWLQKNYPLLTLRWETVFWVNGSTYVPKHSFCPVCGPFSTFSYSVYIHTSGHSKVSLTSVCSFHSSSAGQSCCHLVDISLTFEAVTLMLLCHSNIPQNVGMFFYSLPSLIMRWQSRRQGLSPADQADTKLLILLSQSPGC